MGKMLVTYEKVFTIQIEVDNITKGFGEAKDKADIEISKMTREEQLNKSQEGYWEEIECEVVEKKK